MLKGAHNLQGFDKDRKFCMDMVSKIILFSEKYIKIGSGKKFYRNKYLCVSFNFNIYLAAVDQ